MFFKYFKPKISIIILIAFSPFVYYLWNNEILGIGNWGRKRKDTFEDKIVVQK